MYPPQVCPWGARHGIEFNGSRWFTDEMNARQAREGLPPRQRLRAMFVIEIALAMSVLDGAIANIALPTIAAKLRTEPASAIWVDRVDWREAYALFPGDVAYI